MWSTKHLNELQKAGKIRGYKDTTVKENLTVQTRGRIVAKHFKKRSKEKDWIGWSLLVWCNERSLQLQEEFRFSERKYRFDWCIESLKLGIEYNGIMSAKSRHTTITGYTGDMNKLNAAQALGWKVLQFTPLNYKNLITELNTC